MEQRQKREGPRGMSLIKFTWATFHTSVIHKTLKSFLRKEVLRYLVCCVCLGTLCVVCLARYLVCCVPA